MQLSDRGETTHLVVVELKKQNAKEMMEQNWQVCAHPGVDEGSFNHPTLERGSTRGLELMVEREYGEILCRERIWRDFMWRENGI